MKLSNINLSNFNTLRDIEFDSICKVGDNPPCGRYLIYIDDPSVSFDLCCHIDRVVAVVTTNELAEKFMGYNSIGVACAKNVKYAFLKISSLVSSSGINKKTKIGNACTISNSAQISATGVDIGDNVQIDDFVRIYSGVKIGNSTIIARGAVLGSSTYERSLNDDGVYEKVEHNGKLSIGNNVVIEENVIIDKALFNWDYTRIGDGCYIGRNVDISHGCKIGANSTILPHSFLCGNITIGNRVKIAPGAIIANRIKIGDLAFITLGAVVTKDVKDGMKVSGNFAVPHDKLIRFIKNLSD